MLTWEGSWPNSLVRRPPWLQACSVKNKTNKNSRSWNKNCQAVTFPKNDQKNLFSFLMTWKYLKIDFWSPSHQDIKKNSLVHFLGEVKVRQFCFEIYWPLFCHYWKVDYLIVVYFYYLGVHYFQVRLNYELNKFVTNWR